MRLVGLKLDPELDPERVFGRVRYRAYRVGMRLLGRAFQLIVGLALLVGLIGLSGWIVYSSITTAPAVVAAVITGLAAVMGLAIQRYYEQQREDLRARRERMAPIYEDLVQLLFDAAKSGGDVEQNMVEFFEKLAKNLLVWGSEPVILAVNRWRAIIAIEEGGPASLFAYEDLLYAVREDLGIERKNLGRGDLLRVFVNDVDDFLAQDEEQTRSNAEIRLAA